MGIPNTYAVQLVILAVVGIFYTLVTTTGLEKGIQHLANFNVILTFIVAGFILLFGPGRFIIDQFLTAFGYTIRFVAISLFRGADSISLTPGRSSIGVGLSVMLDYGVFVARISRVGPSGRLLLLSLIAPIVIICGLRFLAVPGIFYELK